MFDAAVIGGGLAGCSAVVSLARQGRRVLLLEAGTYPRPKVCGEFLSPETATLFEQLGETELLMALNPVLIRTVRIAASGGAAWRGRFPAPALGISRYALDKALADDAAELGVQVCERSKVTRIDGDLRGGFTLSTQGGEIYEAKAVIAAYGKRSTLDRVLERPSSGPYMALKQHFEGPPLADHIDLYVFDGGYCGMSQVEDGTTNVCLLVKQSVFQAVSGGGSDAVPRFIAWMGEQNPELGRWLAQAVPVYDDWLSIAQVSVAAKTPMEGDILLAGDCAGMIAPLAGDGMAMAVQAGILAAHSVGRFLSHLRDATATKREYTDVWRRTFAGRLRLGRVLQGVMLRPRLIGPSLRVMSRVPALGDWLVRQTRDLHLLEATP
jgi:menaquinone-9 beta-reductase